MKQRRRLHWAWRVAVAVGVASAGASVAFVLVEPFSSMRDRIDLAIFNPYLDPFFDVVGPDWREAIAPTVVWVSPGIVLAVAIYGLLTRYYGPASGDAETRCRNCRYILRGITEPGCPECGERI